MIVGIDRGTINRACAIWRNDAPVLVPNAPGDYPTPSAVGIGGDDAVLVGRPHSGNARQEVLRLPPRRFALTGDIVRDVLRRTGFKRERCERSLSKDGDIADQCKVQVAIGKAALVHAKTGNELLRHLQSAGFGD